MLPYVRIHASTRETQELDSNISRVVNSIKDNPLLSSPVLIKGIVFTSTNDTIIFHKLDRQVNGYIIVGKNAAEDIYTSSTVNTLPFSQVILKAEGSVTADILFF